jgi:hypothetical protein
MRSVFSKSVNDERVKVSDGTFDTTGVEDGWADLVVIAQVSLRNCAHIFLRFKRDTRPSTGAPITNVPPRSSSAF